MSDNQTGQESNLNGVDHFVSTHDILKQALNWKQWLVDDLRSLLELKQNTNIGSKRLKDMVRHHIETYTHLNQTFKLVTGSTADVFEYSASNVQDMTEMLGVDANVLIHQPIGDTESMLETKLDKLQQDLSEGVDLLAPEQVELESQPEHVIDDSAELDNDLESNDEIDTDLQVSSSDYSEYEDGYAPVEPNIQEAKSVEEILAEQKLSQADEDDIDPFEEMDVDESIDEPVEEIIAFDDQENVETDYDIDISEEDLEASTEDDVDMNEHDYFNGEQSDSEPDLADRIFEDNFESNDASDTESDDTSEMVDEIFENNMQSIED